MHRLTCLLLCAACATAGAAPPPATPELLVVQERAFALDVEASGVRGGFLRYLPPDGGMLLPTPAAGVPVVPPAPSAGAAQPQIEFGNVGGEVFMGTCPDCGSQLEFAEGCVKCHVCGFSECG